MKVKEESEKAVLKLNIQKTKIMASSPITSLQIDGETMATVRDYFGGAPKSLQMVSATMKLKDACSLEERAPLVAQMVKHLPAMWETRVQSLGWEYPLEKEMATHCNTLAWKIPWTMEPGRLPSMGSQRVGHD